MEKIFSRLYPGDVVQTIGTHLFRKYSKAPPVIPTTTVIYRMSGVEPYLRLTKLDDSPTVITWHATGKVDTFTTAGNITSSSGATTASQETVTIESHGKWKAGHSSIPLLATASKANWSSTELQHVTLDSNCVGVLPIGLGCRMKSSTGSANPHKIFIPKSVVELSDKAFYVYNTTLSSYAFQNAEFEFESVTPPAVGANLFWASSPPLRIIVPAAGLDAYKAVANLAAWSSYIVGK